MSRAERLVWKKLVAVNREVEQTLVKAHQADAPPEIMAAVQTGGVELGSQLTGQHLSEALGKTFPTREAIRSSLLLLGWHQLLPTRYTDMESYEALERGQIEPSDLPYVVDDPERRSEEIGKYVSLTGANRNLIEEATTLYLELAHGDEGGRYPRWRYQAIRGLLTGNTQWRDDRDFMEVMQGATYAAVMSRDLAAFYHHLSSLPNPLVTSTVDASALFQYWNAFPKQNR